MSTTVWNVFQVFYLPWNINKLYNTIKYVKYHSQKCKVHITINDLNWAVMHLWSKRPQVLCSKLMQCLVSRPTTVLNPSYIYIYSLVLGLSIGLWSAKISATILELCMLNIIMFVYIWSTKIDSTDTMHWGISVFYLSLVFRKDLMGKWQLTT